MKPSRILWHLNRPWRTPIGKVVSLVLATVGIYAGYTQLKEVTTAVRVKGGEVRYDDSVAESEAKALADYLVAEGFFGSSEATVRLSREDDAVKVQFVIKEAYVNDPEVATTFSVLAGAMSQQLFGGKRTVVSLCDEELNDLRQVEPVNLGTLLQVNKTQIFYTGGATEEEAREVAIALGAGDEGKEGRRLQLVKSGASYAVKMVADAAQVKADPLVQSHAILFAQELSARAFDGATVEFHFADSTLKTILSVASTDPVPAGGQ
jgi:hypothetical protein